MAIETLPPAPASGVLQDERLPYGPLMLRVLPGMRRGMLAANRYLAVPLLRSGLAPLFTTPWTGSLMVLRTRGRRSGEWRDAPLGYLVRDGNVYCCAGFGRSTHWLRNLQADPRVEVLLPGRAVSGVAELVTAPSEAVAAMRALMGSMTLISRPMIGDLDQATDEEVRAIAERLPLVRIRVTGLAAGPWDPGGSGWAVTWGLGVILLARWAWRRANRRPSG